MTATAPEGPSLIKLGKLANGKEFDKLEGLWLEALGNPGYSWKELVPIAGQVGRQGAADRAEALLDTLIGQQGVRLSGGQRQRLAIARMILTQPQVVILDEATSALDIETETRLHRDLSRFLEDRTTLIIAHRLSAVKQADRVYVFEDGNIIEEGTHDELIQGEGLYQRLYGQH